MIKHYITGAIRNILKRKYFYVANVLVLSIVFAASSHLYRYIFFKHSYDNFHDDSKNIYRVTTKVINKDDANTLHYALCYGKYGKMMKDEYPQVIDYVNLTPMPDDCTILIGNHYFRENKAYYAESTFFSFFSFELLSGKAEDVLSEPYTVVLSESIAHKYFKDSNPVGKIIALRGKYHNNSYLVTGVFRDPPSNSHIQARILVSNLELYDESQSFENTMRHWTYIKVSKRSDIKSIEEKINNKLERISRYGNETWQFEFQNLESIHLYSRLRQEMREVTNGNAKSVYLILLIGIVCLIIAFINFINSSLTRNLERSGEIGIRNTLGADFKDHVKLFFTEAFILILLSLFIGIIIYFLSVKPANEYFGYSESNIFGYSENSIKVLDVRFLFMLASVLFFISTLFSLAYAVFYSRVNTLNTLQKRKRKVFSKKLTLKSLPILIQFTVCFLLMSFMIIVFQQNNYIKNKDLGYDPKNVVSILQPHIDKRQNLKNLMIHYDEIILKNPIIESVTRCVYNPGYQGYGQWRKVKDTKGENDNFIVTPANAVMYSYFDLYDIQFLAGKTFEKEGKGGELIISENLLPLLNYSSPNEIIGEYLYFMKEKVKVIGVVEDVHQETLDKKIKPLVYYQEIDNYGHAVSIRYAEGKFEEAIKFLESEWYKIFPESDFVYEIVENKISDLYKEQTRFQDWLAFFTFLALVISIVGISILTVFSFKENEKEIAIRKVLGASLLNISITSVSFIKVIGISMILGLSISTFIAKDWLSTYLYRTKLNVWFYMIPIMIVLFVFIINFGFSGVKAYFNNPADSLKDE